MTYAESLVLVVRKKIFSLFKMAGGLLQLLAYGQNNIYLTGSPQITHFKSVYKTHSNFSMESISVNFNRTDANINSTTSLIAKIDRNADLVGQVYLSFQLPDILSDNVWKFRWVENLAEALINDIYITIGGNKIDEQNGEYIHLLNMLNYGKDKREVYNRMIGNIDEFTNPENYYYTRRYKSGIPLKYRIGNEYPASSNFNFPSIRSRTFFLPLTFWFNKDLANALPLVSLQYSDVQIVVTLNPINQLYKLFYTQYGIQNFYAPDPSNPAHDLRNFVTNGNQTFMTTNNILNIRANLEVNYIFLDTKERMFFAYKPIEYLIEQVRIIPFTSLSNINTLELVLQNPVKEIIWVCKRNDVNQWNNWFEYTDKSANIMTSATILFNGMERLRQKTFEYFAYLEPFQHHKGCAQEGIYLYSFSIRPEEFQPSGACNMSKINKIQIAMTLNEPSNQFYKYNTIFFVTNYNILKISNGMGGTVFAL